MTKPAKGEDGMLLADRTLVLQQAKQKFMKNNSKTTDLVDSLTKCLFILFQEPLASTEATNLFFHITRLFQYKEKDKTLRRLIYIAIKVLSQHTENIYVVTPSLTNDVNSLDDPALRASALRALCQISDSSTFAVMEPFIKQGVVDKNSVVASAALSSMIRIALINSDVIRKFTDEIQEALDNNSPMVQYHALGLSYNLCKNDKQVVSQLISNCIQKNLKSPLAICLLIRIIASSIDENNNSQEAKSYVRDKLEHISDMVKYEAANAITNLKCSSADTMEYKLGVSKLRNFLTSNKAALRFASVRVLNELAATSSTDIRFWSVHRIGAVCKLHLLNKRYKPGDHIIGILDFTNSSITCAKYTVILQCEEAQQYQFLQEFSLGLRKNNFMMAIPLVNTKVPVLHCVLSFLFYISDKNYPKTLFEDRAGTIELGPSELETKLFSCDFPIAVYN